MVGGSTTLCNDKKQNIQDAIHVQLYLDVMSNSGDFMHFEHIKSTRANIAEMQGVMAVNMPEHGTRLITNSDDLAMRIDEKLANSTRTCVQDILINKAIEFHSIKADPNTKKTIDWSKVKQASSVKELSSLIHHQEYGDCCWDDVKGGWLPIDEVRKARAEEMAYVRKTPLYVKVRREEAARAGKAIIPVRWVDTKKGTEGKPNFRSRIVAQEFKRNQPRDLDHELFSAMPPIEAIRMVVSAAASAGRRCTTKCVMVADVRRAYFHAKARREVFVEIPSEDMEPGDELNCARLLASMYGTRDAARNWGEELQRAFGQMGARVGKASGSVYRIVRPNGNVIRTAIHGDDIVSSGNRSDLKWLETELRKRFDIKVDFLGLGAGMRRELKILNRVFRVDDEGFSVEADPRHVQILINECAMQEANATTTPTDQGVIDAADAGEQMDPQEARIFRGLAARLNYLAIDRADLRIAALAASKRMAQPTTGCWSMLRRVARYLKGQPRLVARMDWQDAPGKITTYTDSDWAGDPKTRKSVSGGVSMHGSHMIKSWAKGQGAVALSSMEAELYSMVYGSVETKGIQSICGDMDIDVECEIYMDSSAAMGLAQKEGLGKAKHVAIHWLWVQQETREGRLKVRKVPGKENPADLMTKSLNGNEITKHLARMRCFPEPRPPRS